MKIGIYMTFPSKCSPPSAQLQAQIKSHSRSFAVKSRFEKYQFVEMPEPQLINQIYSLVLDRALESRRQTSFSVFGKFKRARLTLKFLEAAFWGLNSSETCVTLNGHFMLRANYGRRRNAFNVPIAGWLMVRDKRENWIPQEKSSNRTRILEQVRVLIRAIK